MDAPVALAWVDLMALAKDSVRQVGVISGLGPGRHDQAALGVIWSVISSSIVGEFSSAIASTCM